MRLLVAVCKKKLVVCRLMFICFSYAFSTFLLLPVPELLLLFKWYLLNDDFLSGDLA